MTVFSLNSNQLSFTVVPKSVRLKLRGATALAHYLPAPNNKTEVAAAERSLGLGRAVTFGFDLSLAQPAASVEQLTDGDALDVFHGQEAHPRPLAEVVRPHDVLIRKPPRQPDLVLESRQQRGVGQQLGTEGLDGDLLVQLQVPRAVHGSHSAPPDEILYNVFVQRERITFAVQQ